MTPEYRVLIPHPEGPGSMEMSREYKGPDYSPGLARVQAIHHKLGLQVLGPH